MKELPGTLSFFIRHAIILVLFLVFSSGNALAQDFTISGYVKEDGAGLSGVTMSGLPGSPVTDATGFYSDTVPSGWTGTVTPSLAGYTFDPSFIPYTNVITDQINQNYEVTYKEFITNAELVNISEGGVASFQVKLSFPPESSITATVSRLSGDSDITVSSGPV